MQCLKRIKDRIVRSFDREYKRISETLQAHSETELLVKLGSELGEFSKSKGIPVDEIDMESFSSAIPYLHVPIYGQARKAIKMLDQTGEDLIRDYAKHYLTYKPNKDDIQKLAISGGGGKGNVYVGAISGLEQIGVMDRIKHVSGASAGAITALSLSLGYTSSEIGQLIQEKDFNRFFYNSSGITRAAAKVGYFFSDYITDDQTKSRLTNILEGNFILESVAENVAPKLDEIIKNDKNLKSLFDNFLSYADVDAIKLTLDQTRDKSDLLMQRILEQEKEHRLFNEKINSYKSARLDNRAEGEIWVHQYGKDHLGDEIHSLHHALLQNKSVQNAIDETRRSVKEIIGREAFESNEEVLTVAIRMRRGQHQIEEFFADMVERKMEKLVQKIGVDNLTQIDERLETREGRRQVTLQAINDIATKHPESGFKQLDMAITKGKSLSSIFDGEGVIVDKSKRVSSLDSVAHLSRISMSIPIVFNTVRTDLGNFVDGGVRNNLPTIHWDESSSGLDKTVLSIIPVTEKEANKNFAFNDIFGNKFSKMNKSYSQMSMRESFRTIILNTGKYDTMDFSTFTEQDFETLNSQARDKIIGNSELNQYGLFHKYYNAQLSFLDTKLINYQESKKFHSILEEYNSEKIHELSDKPPFQHVANRNSLSRLFAKSKNVIESNANYTI